MAKMQTRVRVSELKGIACVGAKGSALNVTDSTATARVFAAWLIRIGDLLVAASAVRTQIDTTNAKINSFVAQHGKLILIQDGSVAVSGMTTMFR
jgi:hypothetical protein